MPFPGFDSPITWSICNSSEINELVADERREYADLSHDGRRRDWLAGRAAAKKALAAHCRIPASEIRLAARIGAAPLGLRRNPDASWSELPVSISISHHDGVALAAVADKPAAIGVDVATLGEIEPAHRRYFLAPGEWPIAERIGATALWALKEAAWKAVSISPDTPFLALELAIDEANRVSSLRLHGRSISANGFAWQVDDRVAAVVYAGADAQ